MTRFFDVLIFKITWIYFIIYVRRIDKVNLAIIKEPILFVD